MQTRKKTLKVKVESEEADSKDENYVPDKDENLTDTGKHKTKSIYEANFLFQALQRSLTDQDSVG